MRLFGVAVAGFGRRGSKSPCSVKSRANLLSACLICSVPGPVCRYDTRFSRHFDRLAVSYGYEVPRCALDIGLGIVVLRCSRSKRYRLIIACVRLLVRCCVFVLWIFGAK